MTAIEAKLSAFAEYAAACCDGHAPACPIAPDVAELRIQPTIVWCGLAATVSAMGACSPPFHDFDQRSVDGAVAVNTAFP